MRVTFVCPPLNLSGGCRVAAIYAQMLKSRGHTICVVAPAHQKRRYKLNIFGSTFIEPQPSSHFDRLDIDLRILRDGNPIRDTHLPSADVVIATWWETAEWVAGLSAGKGKKVYFIQGHEIYPWLPQKRCRATYRAPLHKIVISNWLNEIIKSEYGDYSADVVPNGVDHVKFHYPIRGKQARPTIGMLHSRIPIKGFDVALTAIESVRKVIPDLRVLTFGLEAPSLPLPNFIEFIRDPPQDTLRTIYGACDVWLSASRSEGFNLPAMEAMACRTPVVATRTGWPSEAVVNGVNGACVAVDDVEALARETQGLLQLSDVEWRRVSQRAFDTVRDSTWERSGDLFEQALLRAVGGKLTTDSGFDAAGNPFNCPEIRP